MTRLIDADALKEALNKSIVEAIQHGNNFSDAFKNDSQEWSAEIWTIEGKIDNAPTVDAEPVRHGKWIPWKYHNGFRCDKCNEPVDNKHNYCPNCGARMDGEDERPSSDACDQVSELVMERIKAEKILEQLWQNLGEVFGKIDEVIDDYCNEILKEARKKS